jgi:bacterioferritin-associated ferredoxin
MIVCLCAGVPASTIRALIERGVARAEELTAACGAGGGCGACLDSLTDLLVEGRRRPARDLASP